MPLDAHSGYAFFGRLSQLDDDEASHGFPPHVFRVSYSVLQSGAVILVQQ
jgi:hypothetical protein